jgi:CII-binding regulator of phage lambda lysogenization HflD
MLYGNFIVDFLWLIELPFGMVILSPLKLTCFHGNFVATQNFFKSKLSRYALSVLKLRYKTLCDSRAFAHFKLRIQTQLRQRLNPS